MPAFGVGKPKPLEDFYESTATYSLLFSMSGICVHVNAWMNIVGLTQDPGSKWEGAFINHSVPPEKLPITPSHTLTTFVFFLFL